MHKDASISGSCNWPLERVGLQSALIRGPSTFIRNLNEFVLLYLPTWCSYPVTMFSHCCCTTVLYLSSPLFSSFLCFHCHVRRLTYNLLIGQSVVLTRKFKFPLSNPVSSVGWKIVSCLLDTFWKHVLNFRPGRSFRWVQWKWGRIVCDRYVLADCLRSSLWRTTAGIG